MKESKIVEVFIQAQDKIYYQHLLLALGKSFIEVLKMGGMIEEGIKTGRIGHSIEDYRDLKREIEKMIQDGSIMVQNIDSEGISSHVDITEQINEKSSNMVKKLKVKQQGEEVESQATRTKFCFVVYYDNNPLQDMCVAVDDFKASVFVNGKIGKDPKLATADDFFASGLNVSGNAVPVFGIAATIVDVNNMPGLNTLGITVARFDLEPQGLVPFHIHPLASALSSILKILNPGDVFAIPQGLIHFLYNLGNNKATFLATFNSQNPGHIRIPSSIIASEPPIMDEVLAKGFQLNNKEIAELRKKFS
ncbi:putative germin-like protein 2-1-like [Capsicum annuum]|nr:putative germin-like protein 2-1-like [Capsicum annuum]KAF3669502.1 putative germin-like protein 2-1-like [Capsicum annuum]